MVMQAFNSEDLKGKLCKLNKSRQLAFGVMCCERLLPNYLAFQKDAEWGDINLIQKALDYAWESLNGIEKSIEEIEVLITSCEKVTPDSENFESLYVSLAQDCVFAICSLLDYLLKSEVDKIVQVATYATDSVDLYVQEIEDMASDDPYLESKILNHKLMQRELETQQKNLQSIEQASLLNSEYLSWLKASWSNNGKSNLDLS